MKRVWHNKAIVKGKLALSAQDRGLTLGDGVFETIAVNKGVALWRFEHIERMRKAAEELGIPFPEDDIENAIDALTHRSRDMHVLRLTLTRGEGGRGLAGDAENPTLVGTLQPFDSGLRFQAATVVTAAVRRNLHSPASRLKTLSYVDNILAARAALAAGADDALMLNSAGRVACSTIGNVFLVMGDVLVTPALDEGILPGIMREAVMQLTRSLGGVVKERQVKPAELLVADHVIITNSLRFLRPVRKLDEKRYAVRSKLLDRLKQGLLQVEQEQIEMS